LSGSTVYAGGAFTNIGGQPRRSIAALEASTGAATAWDPDANSTVSTLVVSGLTVYAGGWFTNIGGQVRHYVAALDASTGLATDWDPSAGSKVNTLALDGTTVYAGGFFTSIKGVPRGYIAAIDASTGFPSDWDPGANGNVYTLAVSGTTVYAGGMFTNIGGNDRNHIAALDPSTGQATGWDPNADGAVYALAISGSTVYVGGLFNYIAGVPRNNMVAVDAVTCFPTSWDPNADSTVYALAVESNRLYAGGSFQRSGSASQPYLAQFDGPTLVELGSFTAKASKAGILIEWLTLSEKDTAGFHLWRSTSRDGEYVRITVSLIPAEGDANSGAAYAFEDTDVFSGKEAWYRLEVVNTDSSSSFHGPVSAAANRHAITLLSPAPDAALPRRPRPTFRWEAKALERFRLEFSNRADFSATIPSGQLTSRDAGGPVASRWITAQSYRPGPKEWKAIQKLGRHGKPVYWRVTGKDGADREGLSEVRAFTVLYSDR